MIKTLTFLILNTFIVIYTYSMEEARPIIFEHNKTGTVILSNCIIKTPKTISCDAAIPSKDGLHRVAFRPHKKGMYWMLFYKKNPRAIVEPQEFFLEELKTTILKLPEGIKNK